MTITALFAVFSVAFFNAVAFSIPKKLSVSENLWSVTFVLLVQLITDIIFDVKYDLYGYFNTGIDMIALFYFIGIYPAFTVILLNLYPYGQNITRKVLYLAGMDAFCLLYEAFSIQTGIFYHNNWNLWYSMIGYPCYFVLILLHLALIRKLSPQETAGKG